MKTRLTPFAKLLIVLIIIAGLVFIVYKTNLLNIIAPGGEKSVTTGLKKSDDVIKIGVVTWGGYAGGQYFNEGFKPNKESRFYKDYGFMVDFKVLDDFNDSRSAWKTDEVNLLWATVDAFTTEIAGLKEFNPQIIFQADWSRGGDAVVVRRGINNVADLKGKKVAFAEMTPSHTFLLWLLEAGNLGYNDIEAVKVANAIDAADLFKKQQVDAAVVWSPDDADCVAKVTGSKVLQSTKQASYIIADVFIAKKDYVEKNREKLLQLLEGWMKGAAEINASETAKQKAAKILAEGLQQPEDFCLQAINNVRLCTYGDNINFFNLKGNYSGVTGEDLYNKMSVKYAKIGYETTNIPSWRLAANASLVSSINLPGSVNEAEGAARFEQASATAQSAQAISTKAVRISFPTGSYQLDENAKYIIDNEFLDIAKMFGNARIRIEGNTDNTGSAALNKTLSYKRAKAVADYLTRQHGFDYDRFVIVGNGPDKPIADNSTEEGRAKNRRTDFELLPE
ncbi:MAG: OmpA family protein [Bacteroidales bacterium]|nr:OmpA family protein [Bacteroidales bacterium]